MDFRLDLSMMVAMHRAVEDTPMFVRPIAAGPRGGHEGAAIMVLRWSSHGYRLHGHRMGGAWSRRMAASSGSTEDCWLR
jgi:hypothetical protein